MMTLAMLVGRARPRRLHEPLHSRHASLLVPSFHRSEIVGFIAGFGTTFAAIPDLVTDYHAAVEPEHQPDDGDTSWRCFRLP